MYQAWVIQKFNGDPMNVFLGDDFETKQEAYETICLWEDFTGKIECGIIDDAGAPIPTNPKKKEKTFSEKVREFFKL